MSTGGEGAIGGGGATGDDDAIEDDDAMWEMTMRSCDMGDDDATEGQEVKLGTTHDVGAPHRKLHAVATPMILRGSAFTQCRHTLML